MSLQNGYDGYDGYDGEQGNLDRFGSVVDIYMRLHTRLRRPAARRTGRAVQAMFAACLCVIQVPVGCAGESASITSLVDPSNTVDQQDPSAAEVLRVLAALFEGVRVRNTAALHSMLHADARFIAVDGERVRVTTRAAFLRELAASSDVLLERAWHPEVRVDGNIAAVWTPYDFHVGDAFSHCGMDSVQLLRRGGRWMIVSIVYTVHNKNAREGCVGMPETVARPVAADPAVAQAFGRGAPTDGPVARPRNVVLMIGDGMGFDYLKVFRLATDDASTPAVEMTVFDRHLVGVLATDPAGPPGTITDSAASATAMSTGVRTQNGFIGVGPGGAAVETVLERAVTLGKSTGLVATSNITHATPAAFASHYPDRRQESAIADQLLDRRMNGQPLVSVMLGGGQRHFRRPDRDLMQEFAALGYEVLSSPHQLHTSRAQRVLGLFSPLAMAGAADRTSDEPSLADMTRVALSALSHDPQGFFLMVEGSQIDWSGHDNDIVGVVAEMRAFAEAAELVLEFASARDDTLVLITADHATGGLAVGAANSTRWRADVVAAATQSPKQLAERMLAGGDPKQVMRAGTGITIDAAAAAAMRRLARRGASPNVRMAMHRAVSAQIDLRSGTGWTTHDHTATDVPLVGFGPGAHLFRGYHPNTDVARILFDFWPIEGSQVGGAIPGSARP
ncbi:MAG: alkaline phosphatase [Nannocystaceae bacterium]